MSDDGDSREAAKWRKRLRETETERDAIAAEVETLRRSIAEQQIHGHGIEPNAVWATTDLDALLDDTGCVDPNKVATAVDKAKETLGITTGLYVEGEGYSPTVPAGRSFTDAFSPPLHRGGR